MKIAIHNGKTGFHKRWVSYCEQKGIPFKLVNVYANDIIQQVDDCDALMWHFRQNDPRDVLFARGLHFALEQAGKVVFPDFRTAWHFDDKVGQKYLLEAIGAPLVPTYVFYSKDDALSWAARVDFPKVFKLRGGAGSACVQLVHSRAQARRMIRRAFGRGFTAYDPWDSLKERWRKFQLGKAGFLEVIKGIARFVRPPDYSRVIGPQRGYIYFQDFLPGNDSDTRIIVIGQRAFALKRMTRANDFRASGSGIFAYAREVFDERCVRLAFDLTAKLGAQCVAYDFIFDQHRQPLLVEISYGFVAEVYDPCPGYWDAGLRWHEGAFNPQGWMVELVANEVVATGG